ncbi:MAG: Hsp20/alpha crystallin family protein [Verrucomicrobia bacterium]|nr:MAG: Hsp20/alpha crystallin family protein [Verrucomicrobiota bacterium]
MRLIRYTSPAARSYSPALARAPWAGLESEMDRLFAAAWSETGRADGGHFLVDLYEDDHAIYVRAELPGVDRSDIGVELAEGTLQLTARRSVTEGSPIPPRVFSRAINVPENTVQTDKISAFSEHGVLTVTLPKREEAKPRKITVTVA